MNPPDRMIDFGDGGDCSADMYNVWTRCTNCGARDEATIPCGIPVSRFPCPTCKCRTVQRIPKHGVGLDRSRDNPTGGVAWFREADLVNYPNPTTTME